MTVAPDVGVVLVAAGASSRLGGPELKQFRWIAGKPMLLHSLQLFHQRRDVAMVVCVLPRQYAGDPPPWIFQSDVDRLLVSVGGKERGESVLHGLEDLPGEVQIVVVHDAARPFVTMDVVDGVIAEARAGRGAVAALPVTDTLKEVDAEGRVVGTIARNGLWRAQTPQAFPRAMIEQVYAEARRTRVYATDCAALCEQQGFEVVVVRGSERAVKVTEEADFALVEAMTRVEK
jgi:2-C-methyl-D-erythritol 4-phosphate cytidylyltransferase